MQTAQKEISQHQCKNIEYDIYEMLASMDKSWNT